MEWEVNAFIAMGITIAKKIKNKKKRSIQLIRHNRIKYMSMQNKKLISIDAVS